MEITPQINLQFSGIDIVNVQYDSSAPFQNQEAMDLTVNPKVFFPEDKKSEFKILMDVSLKVKSYFEFSLMAIGYFQISEQLDEANKERFVNANAPAIMFPYVRSFISTFTANLGSGSIPVILPTQVFRGKLEEFVPSSIQ